MGWRSVTYSVVIPAHNCAPVIERTVQAWRSRLAGTDYELIVVENGSTDSTTETLEELARKLRDTRVRVMHSDPGMGFALRTGIAASHGSTIILTADDLPFGFTDLDAFEALAAPSTVVIGSKSHPASTIRRRWQRRLASGVFNCIRKVMTRSRVGDSQGTFFIDGPWARRIVTDLREGGFLLSTEIVLTAESLGEEILEVPITYDEHVQDKPSSVRAASMARSARELIALCRSVGRSAQPATNAR